MREPRQRSVPNVGGMPAAIHTDIERAGYYPAVVADVVEMTVAGEEVVAHLVHPETTFDAEDEVRRHVTVLVLTGTRLVIVHADDHTETPEEQAETMGLRENGEAAATRLQPAVRTFAAVSAEAVPLARVNAVVTTHIFERPDRYRPGAGPREITLVIARGVVSRVDLEPAGCEDPDCEADHGYTGSITGDDLSIRVSADAEGDQAVAAALRFAASLSAATAH